MRRILALFFVFLLFSAAGPVVPRAPAASREMVIDKPRLLLPINNGARKRLMRLLVDGRMVRQFEIELAAGTPDFWTSTDLARYAGKTLRMEVDGIRAGAPALATVTLADHLPDPQRVYHEALRPQFHFSPDRGWTNDPNGLVYYAGAYHLFFQHNPYGTKWGNMTWGHAVSTDLVHWTQRPDAIHPDALGTIFSGSAVLDKNNTAGWQTGREPTIVCIYTSAGGTSALSRGQPLTQSIAYSNDRGRTWTKYAKNPVLRHIVGHNRDPKVIWHEPTRQWIMALFLDQQKYALFAAPDLKAWKRLGDIPVFGARECPDFFPLPIDGDPQRIRWVFWGADGHYLIGRFDGRSFVKESGPHQACFGANDYAAQTYSNIPATDGRRIQIAWMAHGKYPGMPFNQQMTVPRRLTLRTTPDGSRLFIEPVREIERLRTKQHVWRHVPLGANPKQLSSVSKRISGCSYPRQTVANACFDHPLVSVHHALASVATVPKQSLEQVSGNLLDIDATFEPGGAETVGFDIHGQKVEYSAANRRLTALGRSATLRPIDGRITLRILVDRTSIEVFANHGRVQMATCFLPDVKNKSLAVYAVGKGANLVSLKVWQLASIWPTR